MIRTVRMPCRRASRLPSASTCLPVLTPNGDRVMCRAKHLVLPVVAFLGLARFQLSHAPAGQPATNVDYNFQIRPLLADRCYACHGPDAKQRKADLRLDTPTGARDAGVTVPGKPGASEGVRRFPA